MQIANGDIGIASSPNQEPDSTMLNDADRTLLQACCDWPDAGPMFYALWRGDWDGFYPSQSEADSGFIYMLAKASWDMRQIERIFMASGLGWRLRTGTKKKHNNYVFDMVNDALRDKAPIAKIETDEEWAKAQAKAKLIQDTNTPQIQIETVPLQFASTSTAPLVALYPKAISSDSYIGLAGEFVRNLVDGDITEADPNILLVNFLQMAGAMIGNGPSLYVTAGVYDRANLFTVNVGDSAVGRKGTSQANTEDIYEAVEPSFSYRIRRDVSTGDGIVHRVRDPKDHPDPKKADPGEPDKRLFIQLDEFASVFAQMRRAGNNISEVLRMAYDGRNLTNSSKTNPQRATKPHITVQGHITIDELIKQPEIETLVLNGFANRFLWLSTKRYKILPFTRQWDAATKRDFQLRLTDVINAARNVQQVAYSPEAQEFYASIYKAQSESTRSLDQRYIGNMRRLGMIEALLDNSQLQSNPYQRVMTVEHLKAAREIVRYASDSARYIFTGRKTNADAERICNLIAFNTESNRSTSKTDIFREFRNHRTNEQIETLLAQLLSAGRIAAGVVSTGGRNKYVYRLIE